ncbi:MAG TPA: STAS domain-containing protein [Anaeromyxobacter sp.]|nr:STAS domain-containing protein [Anaeromyxobacter sp.]
MTRNRSRQCELLIEVDGVFDVPAAKRLGAVLERARPGEAIRIDLGRVSTFQDFGLALLAQALGETRAARIALRGLRLHQLRILRYFGVDPARLRVRVPSLELDLATAVAASADVA